MEKMTLEEAYYNITLVENLIIELESLRKLGAFNLHTLNNIKETLAVLYVDRAALLYLIHNTTKVQTLTKKHNSFQTLIQIIKDFFFFKPHVPDFYKHDQTLLQIISNPHSIQDILNLYKIPPTEEYSLQAPASNSPTPDSNHHTQTHPNLCHTHAYIHPKRTYTGCLGGTGK